MDPLQNRTFCPAISIFHLYFPQLWQTSVSKMCMSMTSYLQSGYERVCRVGTGNMVSLYLLVASLQGSDAGQNILRISGIFNLEVPLWLIRIQSDVTLMDPIQNRTFWPAISIFHLYFPQLCQTSVSKLCMPMPSYLQGGWERIGRISTGNMESLYLLVASLQGSDAGQNILRISGIFNFDVPLWLTRIQSDVATLMDPLQNRTFCPAISIFHLYYPQLWQTSVSKLCMPMPSYLQGGWERVGRIGTGNMESLYLLVASLQGSDAGQNILRISGIFNFDVPLWLTRIQSDVVTLMDPLQNRTFCPAISIFHLYFPQLWQTSVSKMCMSMTSYLQSGYERVCRVGTGNMVSLYLLVASLQGSDAGQNILRISEIFNLEVPLWLIRIQSDVTLMDPIQNRTFCPAISIFHLYFPQLWQTSVSELSMPMTSYLHGG